MAAAAAAAPCRPRQPSTAEDHAADLRRGGRPDLRLRPSGSSWASSSILLVHPLPDGVEERPGRAERSGRTSIRRPTSPTPRPPGPRPRPRWSTTTSSWPRPRRQVRELLARADDRRRADRDQHQDARAQQDAEEAKEPGREADIEASKQQALSPDLRADGLARDHAWPRRSSAARSSREDQHVAGRRKALKQMQTAGA